MKLNCTERKQEASQKFAFHRDSKHRARELVSRRMNFSTGCCKVDEFRARAKPVRTERITRVRYYPRNYVPSSPLLSFTPRFLRFRFLLSVSITGECRSISNALGFSGLVSWNREAPRFPLSAISADQRRRPGRAFPSFFSEDLKVDLGTSLAASCGRRPEMANEERQGRTIERGEREGERAGEEVTPMKNWG